MVCCHQSTALVSQIESVAYASQAPEDRNTMTDAEVWISPHNHPIQDHVMSPVQIRIRIPMATAPYLPKLTSSIFLLILTFPGLPRSARAPSPPQGTTGRPPHTHRRRPRRGRERGGARPARLPQFASPRWKRAWRSSWRRLCSGPGLWCWQHLG